MRVAFVAGSSRERQRQIQIEAKRNRESGKEEYREADRETEQVVLIMHLLRKWIFT